MSKYGFLTVDAESTGKDWTTAVLHGIGIGYSEDEAEYYPVGSIPDSVLMDLADPKISKIGHNIHGYDAKLLKRHGIEVKGELDDTMVIWNLVDDTTPLGLKYLADKHLGEESLENKQFLDRYISKAGAGHIGGLCAQDLADPTRPHTEVIAKYCVEDVLNTTKLFWMGIEKLKALNSHVLKMGFKKGPLDYYKEEARPLERVLMEIEFRGIRVDLTILEEIRANALARMAEIEGILNKVFVNRIPKVEQELYEKEVSKVTTAKAKASRKVGHGKCKFSWANGNHFGSLLYKFCDLDADLVQRTDKGAFQTDKTAIEVVRAGLADTRQARLINYLDLYSEYKKHIKIASTYTGTNSKGIMSKIRMINGVPRIFPQFRQTTGTGRLACSNPNMQNIKNDSEIKRLFIPDTDDEVFDEMDYSQVELCTGAHISKDPGLVDAYIRKEDVHIRTAARLFEKAIDGTLAKKKGTEEYMMRQAGKRTNFLTIFDGKWRRLQACLKADTGRDFTEEQCREFIEVWFEIYPGVKAHLESELEFFKQFKFCIAETGRIRRLPDIIFGEKLVWVPDKENRGKRVPRYKGPMELKQELVASIRRKNPKLPTTRITEDMLGWEANRRFSHATKAGYNMPIQGVAASIAKRSMVRAHNAGKKIVNQVHDSLITSRPVWDLEARKSMEHIMQTTYTIDVPIIVDTQTLRSFHPKDEVKSS